MRKQLAYGMALAMTAAFVLNSPSVQAFQSRHKPMTEAAAHSGTGRLAERLNDLKKSGEAKEYARMARIAKRMLRSVPIPGNSEYRDVMRQAAIEMSNAAGKAADGGERKALAGLGFEFASRMAGS